MIKALLPFFFLVSCALLPDRGPSWVQGLRTGEERIMLTNGQSLLFRQIAPTCGRAIRRTQNLIYRSYSVVPVLEVQWAGSKDCAVTMSIPANSPRVPKFVAPRIGMYYQEYQRKYREGIRPTYDYTSACWQEYSEAGYTHHGTHVICWKDLRIIGYYQEE